MLYARGNFNNVTIYIWQYIHILHWYSVCGAFQLRIKKSYILREELQHMTIVRRAPSKIGKNKIFWRKIVIFHTKYLSNFRASLRNWKKYDSIATHKYNFQCHLSSSLRCLSLPKNLIFSNFRGGARRVRPPLDPPLFH
jgi:hypothetical protein